MRRGKESSFSFCAVVLSLQLKAGINQRNGAMFPLHMQWILHMHWHMSEHAPVGTHMFFHVQMWVMVYENCASANVLDGLCQVCLKLKALGQKPSLNQDRMVIASRRASKFSCVFMLEYTNFYVQYGITGESHKDMSWTMRSGMTTGQSWCGHWQLRRNWSFDDNIASTWVHMDAESGFTFCGK